MVPVALSILVVVLLSGAVLWVVAGEVGQPTSGEGSPAEPAPAAAVEAPRAAPMVASSPPRATVPMAEAPLRRHRARSSLLLVLVIALVGVLLAIVIGALLAALTFALRAAVTS